MLSQHCIYERLTYNFPDSSSDKTGYVYDSSPTSMACGNRYYSIVGIFINFLLLRMHKVWETHGLHGASTKITFTIGISSVANGSITWFNRDRQ